MTELESRGTQALSLSRELLDDLELSRLSPEGILLKAARLARLVGNAEALEWLGYELQGYPSPPARFPTAWKYLNATGRVGATGEIRFGALAEMEAAAAALKLELQTLRVPDVSLSLSSANPHERVTGNAMTPPAGLAVSQTITRVMNAAIEAANNLAAVSGIKSRVLGLIHSWVVTVYHERLFSGAAASIFEAFKLATDTRLAERCADAFEKIPHIYERLGAPDPEAVSHALTTSRRVLDAAADSLFPPSDQPLQRGGQTIELTAKHTKNRLRAYLHDRVESGSRRERLNHTLADLYERCGAGVHEDVTPDEARALLLLVYVFLGEILTLPSPASSPAATVPS